MSKRSYFNDMITVLCYVQILHARKTSCFILAFSMNLTTFLPMEHFFILILSSFSLLIITGKKENVVESVRSVLGYIKDVSWTYCLYSHT